MPQSKKPAKPKNLGTKDFPIIKSDKSVKQPTPKEIARMRRDEAIRKNPHTAT